MHLTHSSIHKAADHFSMGLNDGPDTCIDSIIIHILNHTLVDAHTISRVGHLHIVKTPEVKSLAKQIVPKANAIVLGTHQPRHLVDVGLNPRHHFRIVGIGVRFDSRISVFILSGDEIVIVQEFVDELHHFAFVMSHASFSPVAAMMAHSHPTSVVAHSHPFSTMSHSHPHTASIMSHAHHAFISHTAFAMFPAQHGHLLPSSHTSFCSSSISQTAIVAEAKLPVVHSISQYRQRCEE
mmetsp:Transcript_11770/g.25480  ORF Transcript_11770/g.25480 Transcript_11770/m.25480 type:complete len:238 (-) Transcript_11770:176-889(-)